MANSPVESWAVTEEGLTLWCDRRFAGRVPVEQLDELVFQIVKIKRELRARQAVENFTRGSGVSTY